MASSLREAFLEAQSGGERTGRGHLRPGPNAVQKTRIYNSKDGGGVDAQGRSRSGPTANSQPQLVQGRKAWDHGGKSRHARGYGTAWDKLRAEVMKRDHGLCQPCDQEGRVTVAHAVDHITPKALGGTDDLANLQAICRECHIGKTMRDSGKTRRKRGCDINGWPL